MGEAPRIGIDLGGTKIKIIALDGEGAVLFEKRIATPVPDYLATLNAICELIVEAERTIGQSATVGIGTPGSLLPKSGLLRNSNSEWMNAKALADDLKAMAGCDLRFANDANCFTLSEVVDGSGKDAGIVFGVILGTGCGGGVAVNGDILDGANGIVGEWGHTPLPWPNDSEYPAPDCWCGHKGCLELWLSGSGLARDHLAVTKEVLGVLQIVAKAEQGNRECQDTLNRHTERLARSLACICNILDPNVIVLGGGLSNMAHLYKKVPSLMESFIFSDYVTTRLLPPLHGDASGARGAAWLW